MFILYRINSIFWKIVRCYFFYRITSVFFYRLDYWLHREIIKRWHVYSMICACARNTCRLLVLSLVLGSLLVLGRLYQWTPSLPTQPSVWIPVRPFSFPVRSSRPPAFESCRSASSVLRDWPERQSMAESRSPARQSDDDSSSETDEQKQVS